MVLVEEVTDKWNKIEVCEQTQTYVIIKCMKRRFK